MSPHSASHIEILLVDDDEADVLLTTQMLKRGKLLLEVKVANDGEDALRQLEGALDRGEALPDLVLLDINMPRLNGFETLERIREHEGLCGIPVVMLTTSDAPQDVKRVYELGANCYVTKPVTFDQFQKVISLLKEFWFTVVKLPTKE